MGSAAPATAVSYPRIRHTFNILRGRRPERDKEQGRNVQRVQLHANVLILHVASRSGSELETTAVLQVGCVSNSSWIRLHVIYIYTMTNNNHNLYTLLHTHTYTTEASAHSE